MSAIPCFDFGAAMDAGSIPQVAKAAREIGCFYARHPLFPAARCEQALADARAFFGSSQVAKERLAIERSPHFRGYSEMRNERDWREQIHFGREEAGRGPEPDYLRLRGPNLWPDDPAWRTRTVKLMRGFEIVGRAVLDALTAGADLDPLLRGDEEPYWLLKMIHYLAAPGENPRSGVAPHVDFSWITLLLEDRAGLEIRTPAGAWVEVAPPPGALVINLGELLEFVTGGTYQATPHRVIRMPGAESRISLPFFLNPALETTVRRVRAALPPVWEDGHVHRVLVPGPAASLHFGEAELRRKGQGVWCAACVPS